jgi:2-keto-4-pentenoate hydratase/2-oxohepta-3-ene-1,7-dioic acid hydratase in catechol pathway
LKLVTYTDKKDETGKTSTGLVWGNWILDVRRLPSIAKRLGIKTPRAPSRFSRGKYTVLDVIAQGPETLTDLQALSWRVFNRVKPGTEDEGLTRLERSRLLAPIPRPPTLRDFYAFEEHVKAARAKRGLEMVPEWYEIPVFYYSNPNVIYGPDDEIPIPSYTKALDFELEIACVIGKKGRDITAKEAESFIAGYTIMNDWSARDIQAKEMKVGLGPAKAKDFATSLGPWLVTPDELEDTKTGRGTYKLEMTARVNDKQVSKGNMESMHWTFSQMIAHASQDVELQVGDVFGSGTVGTGSLIEQQSKRTKWLRPGDNVELAIERLGTLRNRVIESRTKKAREADN